MEKVGEGETDSVEVVQVEQDRQTKLDLALNQAALNGNLDKVKVYIDAGAKPNWRNPAKNQYLNTALHMAAYRGNAEVAKLLLEAAANPEMENKFHNKPIFFAAYYGHNDVIQVLLKYGADPTGFCRKNGLTALHKACMQGHVSSAKLLLDAGAYPLSLDKKNRSPLEVVGIEGDKEVDELTKGELRNLLQRASVRQLKSRMHDHELAFSVVFVADNTCYNCGSRLDKGVAVFVCKMCPDFALCQKCFAIESQEDTRNFDQSQEEKCSAQMSSMFAFCNVQCLT